MPNPRYSINIFPNGTAVFIQPTTAIAIEGIPYIRTQAGGNCASCEIRLYAADLPLLVNRPFVEVSIDGVPHFYGFVNNAANPKIINEMATVQLIGASRRMYETPLELVIVSRNYPNPNTTTTQPQSGTPIVINPAPPTSAPQSDLQGIDIAVWVMATFEHDRNTPTGLDNSAIKSVGYFGFRIAPSLEASDETVGSHLDKLANYLKGFVVPNSSSPEHAQLVALYPEMDFSQYAEGNIILSARWGVKANKQLFFGRPTNQPLELFEGEAIYAVSGTNVGQRVNVTLEHHKKISLDDIVTAVHWYWGVADFSNHAHEARAYEHIANTTYTASPLRVTELYNNKALFERGAYSPIHLHSESMSPKVSTYGKVSKTINLSEVFGKASLLAKYVPFDPTQANQWHLGGITSGDFINENALVAGFNGFTGQDRPLHGFYQIAMPITKNTKAIIMEGQDVPMCYFIKPDSISPDGTHDEIVLATNDSLKYFAKAPAVLPISILPFLNLTTFDLTEPTTIYICFDLRGLPNSASRFGKLGLLEHSPKMDRIAGGFYKLPPSTVANIHIDNIPTSVMDFPSVVKLTRKSGVVEYLPVEMYETHATDKEYMTTTIKIGQPDDDLVIKDLLLNLERRQGRSAV